MNLKKTRQCLQTLLIHPTLSNREIARQRQCSPTTIATLRSRIEVLGLAKDQLDAMSDSELRSWRYDDRASRGELIWPDWNTVLAELQAGDNRQEAYDSFLDRCGDGDLIAYRTFCKHLEPLLDKKNPTMRLLHKPGDKAMVDYTGYTPRVMVDGQERRAQMFAARLPASGYSFAWITLTQTIPDWLAANEAMFRYYGGVTNYLVSDNLRSAVTEHRRGKLPVLNPTFERFAEHFDTTLAPARPRKPKDKAAAERFVQDVQRKLRRALRGRPLLTIAEINALLLEIVNELNRRIPRRSIDETRHQLFERIDKPALRPLPDQPFVYFTEKLLKVPPTYHVTVEGSEYSVPHRLIASKVVVQTSRTLVEVFHDGKPVAMHQRSWTHGSIVTDPAHMPEGHKQWRAKETTNLELWAESWSEPVQAIMAAEAALGHTGKVRQAQFDLADRLARAHGRAAFEQACRRACAIGNLTIAHVRNLLVANRQAIPNRTVPDPVRRGSGGNVRGAAYYAGEA
ncbi:MAG: IS21 family transposase [Sphingomonadaceae bacterium]